MSVAPMTSQEAREHIARLGISQQALARMIRVNPSTVRRWLDPHHPLAIPRAVEIMLELLTPAKTRRLIETDAD